jgi:hypothetical protein
MKAARTREWTIDLTRQCRKNVCNLQEDTQAVRVPRLARLMALAIRFDGLLRTHGRSPTLCAAWAEEANKVL